MMPRGLEVLWKLLLAPRPCHQPDEPRAVGRYPYVGMARREESYTCEGGT